MPRAWESMLCFSRGRLVLADCEGLPSARVPASPVRASMATLSLLSLMGSSTSAQEHPHTDGIAEKPSGIQQSIQG